MTQHLDIGPWTAYRLESARLKDMRYHGEQAEFSLRHALAWQGELQFELIQPLSGPSIFADHLEAHGESLHHVGKYVDDHPAAVAEAIAKGFTEYRPHVASAPRGTVRLPTFSRPASR